MMLKLEEIRKRRGMSRRALGELLEVRANTVYRWEKGDREPDLGTLKKLTSILDVSIAELLGLSEDPTVAPRQEEE